MIFEKYSNIKCHGNLFSGRRDFMRADGQTDRIKLIVVFLSFSKEPENITS